MHKSHLTRCRLLLLYLRRNWQSNRFLLFNWTQDETVLTHCIKNQFMDAIDGLIMAGSDPNLSSKKGVTPISAAAHKGNIIIMERLILAGAAVNAINISGSTALIQVQTNFIHIIGLYFHRFIFLFHTGGTFWTFECCQVAVAPQRLLRLRQRERHHSPHARLSRRPLRN